MNTFILASVAIIAVMAGYWAGRSVQWQIAEGAEEAVNDIPAVHKEDRIKNTSQKRILLGQAIGSPVSGAVSRVVEDDRTVIRIMPEQGKLYAPISGRISRLYPMGRAIQIRTEFGAELLIQVGSGVDEMHSGYYRCRVMEHEVVRKGKLLLEFDVAGLRAAGAGTEVTMSVENEIPESVSIGDESHILAGEEIMRIRNHLLTKQEEAAAAYR